MKKVAIILVNYGDYAERFFDDCIESINKLKYGGEIKLFIVDNASTDKSFQYLYARAPNAEYVLNKENDGFAKGNNDAMKIALAQGFDYIVLFNMDTIVDANCVFRMVEAIEADDKVGAVQARVMLHPDTNTINSIGNASHFLGFGYCVGYGEGMKDKGFNVRDIAYPSGAAVLFRRDILEKVGLFDEEFWMYNEDQDLGWRIWLAGRKCVVASRAIVFHKYEFSRSMTKYYWMDRNRILVSLKNYHFLSLLVFFPAFLIMELGLLLFSIKQGWFRDKLRVWIYFITPRNILYILKARKDSQALRVQSDREIIKTFTGRIWYQEVGDWKLKLANPFFNAYFWLVRKIIIW